MTVKMAKVLPKGQVTIPKEVHDSLGAMEGDYIVFSQVDGVWTIARQPSSLVEFMREAGREGRSLTLRKSWMTSTLPAGPQRTEERAGMGCEDEPLLRAPKVAVASPSALPVPRP